MVGRTARLKLMMTPCGLPPLLSLRAMFYDGTTLTLTWRMMVTMTSDLSAYLLQFSSLISVLGLSHDGLMMGISPKATGKEEGRIKHGRHSGG